MLAAVSADQSHRSDRAGPTDLAGLGIGLLASPTDVAQAAAKMLRKRYQWAEEDEASTLVALGGDGFMLQTLHDMLETGRPRPVFGMNRGTVGFLMNEWRLDRLAERIQGAKAIRVAPLRNGRRTWSVRRPLPPIEDLTPIQHDRLLTPCPNRRNHPFGLRPTSGQ